MNDEFRSNPSPAPSAAGFQQIDADAVCEQCGTVNEEGTLLCRVCGQNLRDQRARRLAGAQGAPEVLEEKTSRVRVLTGVLSALGIVIVVAAVLNINNIQNAMVQVLTEDNTVQAAGDLWTGPMASRYEEMLADLQQYPATQLQVQDALQNPVSETSYNGRYVLMKPGALQMNQMVGEAELQRRGNRVYFVALMYDPQREIRGYAVLEEVGETGEVRPMVRNTAGFRTDSGDRRGFGTAEPLSGGGHRVLIFSSAVEAVGKTGGQVEFDAYRIR